VNWLRRRHSNLSSCKRFSQFPFSLGFSASSLLGQRPVVFLPAGADFYWQMRVLMALFTSLEIR
jgi:hypothetical protein